MSADHTQTPENEHERIVTALQHAESVLEGIFDGIAVIVDGRSVYVNPSLGKMLGYKTQELMGVEPERFLAPQARPLNRDRMKTLLESVEPDPPSADLTGLRKSGTTFPLEVIARRIQFGGTPALLLTLRDLSHRKRAELALRAAESKYRSLVERSLAGVYVIQDRRFVYVNPQAAKIFGYTQAELLALPNFLALATEDTRHEVAEKVRQDVDNEIKATHYDFQARRKNGRTIHVEVHGGPISYLGRPATIGTCLDITEREAVHSAVRESEERFRTLFERAPIGIVMAGPDTRLLRVNAVFCDMLGYTEKELIGRSFVDISHENDTGGTPESAQKLFANGALVTRLRKRYHRKDGGLVHAESTISFAHNESNELQYAVAMIEDISDRLRLEEQVQQMQRLESVGQLAGGVAHNFNNALTAIYGYTELLSRRFEATDPALRDLEQIQRVAEQSANLTRQLLTFSRTAPVKRSALRINDAIETTRNLLTPLIGGHIHIQLHLDSALPEVSFDPTQMEQIITNLVLNARDAMPDGGTLTIVTERFVVDDAINRMNPEAVPGRYVRVAITDTGTGMDEETASRVFEPFYTTKDQGKGVGLGLALVYGALRQNGGFITVQSELGVGTCFTFYVPEQPRTDEPSPTAATDASTTP